ncbi:MAG: hypothetical protein IKT32_08150 [Clostridia bacterium]|nr:hypothetical protein [Clostridia bacterium]
MRKFSFYLLGSLFLVIAIFLICKPAVYAQACFEGLKIWAITVLPSLLPFFFISLLFTNCGYAQVLCNKLKKPIFYLYGAPSISAFVQIMSFISGYPVGAKLISQLYKEGAITAEESTKISLFTSTSGPMFIVGSVGAGLFLSQKAGIILLVSHLLSAILNGIIFKNYHKSTNSTLPKTTKSNNILYDCAYGATLSCLIVGAFIAVFFVFNKILIDLNAFSPLVFIFSILFKDKEKALAFCAGLIECTNGCILFAKTQGVLTLPLTAFIITFGGVSVLVQSISFLKEAKVNIKVFLLSKVLQAVNSFIICLAIIKFTNLTL